MKGSLDLNDTSLIVEDKAITFKESIETEIGVENRCCREKRERRENVSDITEKFHGTLI